MKNIKLNRNFDRKIEAQQLDMLELECPEFEAAPTTSETDFFSELCAPNVAPTTSECPESEAAPTTSECPDFLSECPAHAVARTAPEPEPDQLELDFESDVAPTDTAVAPEPECSIAVAPELDCPPAVAPERPVTGDMPDLGDVPRPEPKQGYSVAELAESFEPTPQQKSKPEADTTSELKFVFALSLSALILGLLSLSVSVLLVLSL